MRNKIFVLMCLSLLTLMACAPSGLARAPEGTLLRKIQDRGRLVVGVKFDLPTFGYLDPKTKNIEGFDPAVAREIAAYIFGDPNKIEFKEAITKNRESDLQNGMVDVILATYTITDDRAKLVDFSVVYYVTGPRLLVPQASPIKGVADLNGKKVGLTKGSIFVDTLLKYSKPQIVQFDTQGDAVKEMVAGNIDAVAANDVILYGHQLLNPGLNVVGARFSDEVYGAGVQKGQPELLNAVNTAIRNLKTSGKWKELWKKEIGDKIGIQTLPDPPPDALSK